MQKFVRRTLCTAALFAAAAASAHTEVKLAVTGSYSLPAEVLAKFEKNHDAKVTVIKMGSGNEMVNRLILTRSNSPLADAVYGLDNSTVYKAHNAGILADKQPAGVPVTVSLPYALAVNYGFVTLNYDKKWFQEKGLPLPQSLDDLTKPAYKNLLAVPNPGTSSPGLSFLLANIGGLGEQKTFEWWGKMRQNGVKATKGWSEAYYTEFTLNGGSRPLMVGYATSPAAEVYYSKGKLKTPNMGNLFLPGGVYLQVEGAAVLKNSKQPALAAKLVQYLQSPEVQQAVPTSMWMYPAVKNTPAHPALVHAGVPKSHFAPKGQRIAQQQKSWVNQWIRTVVK